MKRPSITMIFSPDGRSNLEINGVQGKSCQDISRFLESEFGMSAVELKPEFYQAELNQQVQQRQS